MAWELGGGLGIKAQGGAGGPVDPSLTLIGVVSNNNGGDGLKVLDAGCDNQRQR